MQRIHVVGRLGSDPELRQTNGGDAVVNFSLADTERWKDKKSGETKSKTEWFRCKCFGRQAEILAEYVHKGEHLAVSGKMRTSEWEKEGVKRQTVELVIDGFELISVRMDGNAKPQDSGNRREQSGKQDEFEDDIPF